MPAEQTTVVSFAKDSALVVQAQMDQKEPCKVTLNSPEKSFNVDVGVQLVAKETIPVCITVCQPIYVKSSYVIGIDVFDNHLGNIKIDGVSTITV